MVNVFSGDFVYNLPVVNIPGPNSSGYALSLSYHAGSGIADDASWVGHGWTINPGSINRSLRGFPDEYKDAPVTFYNKNKPNWTATFTNHVGLEAFSVDVAFKDIKRLNNYVGLSNTKSYTLGAMGIASIGIHVSGDEATYSANISPIGALIKTIELIEKSKNKGEGNVKKGKEQTEE